MTSVKLSIANKLYAIFALMATITVVLSAVAVSTAREHVALTRNFDAANTQSSEVKHISALIYAAYSNSRAIYSAPDRETATKYAAELTKLSDQIGAAVQNLHARVDSAEGDALVRVLDQITAYRGELAEIADTAAKSGPAAARTKLGTNSIFDVRGALTTQLEKLANLYSAQAKETFAALNSAIDRSAMLLTLLAAFAALLAAVGIVMIARNVARPLAAITRVTVAVANGNSAVEVPFSERGDEIGALARSIGVFKQAMQHIKDLSGTIAEDADSQKRNRARMSDEIARFSAEVEATVSELGRIADQMLAASSTLARAADDASAKTTRAEAASTEASSNVHDIASAADELSASVSEIDRQVAQSNEIATKAVNEAEATNVAVKELGDAAARIGDVVKLITDIAEQTNLLALNATIEAARAGEAGRGFAVVAGEVKALAGQTSRATEEIGAQIAGMQRATRRSIQAITAIEHTIREIGNISGAIAAAVTEQGAATQEIARSVEIAARRTEETAGEVNRVGAATEDTRASAGAVKAVADDLDGVAGRIRSQVDQFFERLSA
ncbi:MAG TPA: HAMP domain-containing methyl-accepting chemotaxis protein [Pseudolabrys sp.]|nr:HAMP domain-containing methyl-accepting chemotaxis protein [Pseudolabrys sp.]